MLLDFSTLDRRAAYFWMASTIAPRPVAWVSTTSADGTTNLAPFSFFQMIAPQPPTLMICPQHNGDGTLKDTARNIRETGEFVVNLVSFGMVQQMNATSYSFDAGTSEFSAAGIGEAECVYVKPPRVEGAPVSFECRLADFRLYPEASPTCTIIIGHVLAAHVDPAILDEQQQVDPTRLDLVSRMGADWYGRTNSPTNFSLARPTGWAR
jgi:flavin reductase (DIM6/NTAB) family NADH-FMN oxidoreductase RutF